MPLPQPDVRLDDILRPGGTVDPDALGRNMRSIKNWAELLPMAIAAKVYRTANQLNIADNTQTLITWQAVDQDSESEQQSPIWAAGTPTRLTVPPGFSGLWVAVAQLVWDVNATGTRRAQITLNGGGGNYIGRDERGAAPNGSTPQPVIAPWWATEGDYVQLRGWQISGGPLDVLGGDLTLSWFAIYFIGS